MRRLLTTLSLLGLGLAAAGCEDDIDITETECGFPGNGCWSDKTCNRGFSCNTQRAGEPLGSGVCPATHGVCESASGRPDGGPPPDGPGTDSSRTDSSTPDSATPDSSTPDASTPDSQPVDVSLTE